MLGILIIALGVLMVTSEEVAGKTIKVDDDGGADYVKIQDAIDASDNGDTIRVWEGTYFESVIVNKSVSLIGNGSGTITIDGGEDGDVVTITADWVNMSGFLVTRSGDQGGKSGIRVNSDHNHIINNNCSNNGYGIRLYDTNGCTITNNTCSSNNDYGIRLWDSSTCTITNNTCLSNNKDGIYIWDSSD